MGLWRVLYSTFSLFLPVSLYVVCMHMCIHVCVWSGARVHACVCAWVWKFYTDVDVKRILQSLYILYIQATSLEPRACSIQPVWLSTPFLALLSLHGECWTYWWAISPTQPVSGPQGYELKSSFRLAHYPLTHLCSRSFNDFWNRMMETPTVVSLVSNGFEVS